jgi:hypothetical protein
MRQISVSVAKIWRRQSFVRKTILVYVLGLFLISNLFFLTAYLYRDTAVCQNNFIVGVTGACISPLLIYFQAPFILLMLASYKLSILIKDGGVSDLWHGYFPQLVFEIWLFAVPLFLLARWIYRKSQS